MSGAAPAEPDPTPSASTEAEGPAWLTLAPSTVAVTALLLFGACLGTSALIVVPVWLGGDHGPLTLVLCLAGTVVVTGVSAVADRLRWRTTRYRLTGQRLEMHSGILFKRRRSLARERIRNVDLTAHVLLRMFGLVRLSLGTGEKVTEGTGQSIVLDPIPRADGERLRAELLRRETLEPAAAGPEALARWSPAWIRYAPVSVFTLLFSVGAAGGIFQVADWAGVPALPVEWASEITDRIGAWPALLAAIVVFVLVGAVAMTALWVESWWGYRLERSEQALRVHRGLLTSRSISFETSRIRGVELVEPLGIRTSGAARLDVVATGLRADAEKQDSATLVPGAPRATPIRVAETILGQQWPQTLRAHPAAARRRRLVRAAALIAGLLALAAGVVVLLHPTAFWTSVIAVTTLAGSGLAVAVALDSARNLGHQLTATYLVARRGSIRRGTVALDRSGIIGWRVQQSIFQRRAGVLTLTATTAAGRGRYSVVDVATTAGLALAEEAVPRLLTPFLEREVGSTQERTGVGTGIGA